jgi:glucose/arabinose dehydrogenase
MSRHSLFSRIVIAAAVAGGLSGAQNPVQAQSGPSLVDQNLQVRVVASGLIQPTTLAFIGASDLLVLEKASGRVIRISPSLPPQPVLDLAVNSASERGLLGIALHPNFPATPHVFLYWTESTTLSDSTVLSETPLLGNRVDRYVWNGSSLVFAANLIRLRAIQQDVTNGVERGNHDGGVIRVGPDGKLYVFVGDLGRRGHMQNLRCGPATIFNCPPNTPTPDDQFPDFGPAPDDEHLSGVVLRLNLDGTAPSDNPFFAAGASIPGEVGANIQKVFSYGHRNSFGMAFDPEGGGLWLQENGDDSFSELNLVTRGMNGGWVQIMGPASRIAQFREIETTFGAQNLQQLRWAPTNIATLPGEALSRLFTLPNSHYEDPAFSWKWEVAPGGIGFVRGRALGPQYDGDLVVGAGTPILEGGYLFRFNLTGNRRKVGVDDPRLDDRVADNLAKHEITESESLLFGRNFGVTTDVQTGPNGNLFVVSLTNGAIYEISRR